MAVASAGPYASLHLAPDRQPHQHPSSRPPVFLQAGCPSCRPTNSVRALKARLLCADIEKILRSISDKVRQYQEEDRQRDPDQKPKRGDSPVKTEPQPPQQVEIYQVCVEPRTSDLSMTLSAGLTMWQMWQMPRASGLRGPPEVEKIFSARQ